MRNGPALRQLTRRLTREMSGDNEGDSGAGFSASPAATEVGQSRNDEPKSLVEDSELLDVYEEEDGTASESRDSSTDATIAEGCDCQAFVNPAASAHLVTFFHDLQRWQNGRRATPTRSRTASVQEKALAKKFQRIKQEMAAGDQLSTADMDVASAILALCDPLGGGIQPSNAKYRARFQQSKLLCGPWRETKEEAEADRRSIAEAMSHSSGFSSWEAGRKEAQALQVVARVARAERTKERRQAKRAAAAKRKEEAVAKARARKRLWTPAKKHPALPGCKVRTHTVKKFDQVLGRVAFRNWKPLRCDTELT